MSMKLEHRTSDWIFLLETIFFGLKRQSVFALDTIDILCFVKIFAQIKKIPMHRKRMFMV